MTRQSDHYSYRVSWSQEDQEHVGTCIEFPSLSWLASSPEAALKGIRRTVLSVMEDMEKSGEPIPEPLAERSYSGKFLVRVPPEVHRELSIQAAEAGVSLNRLVSSRLSQ